MIFKLDSQKMISEPTLAHHLSLGSSMVRPSNWSSEGCGFDPCLGLRNHFLKIELEDRLSTLLLGVTNHKSEVHAMTI